MQYRNTSYAEGVFDTYWYEKNLQGDVVKILNTSGSVVASYTYDAWGKVTSSGSIGR
jgi:YD repeat-containing protein